jgi:hypothetical protein
MTTMTQIQLTQLQPTFKDSRCPVLLADAQPVVFWCADGIMHAQYRALHFTDVTTGAAEASPLVEVVMPLSVFFSMLDGANAQAQMLEKQGIKRVPIAAVTPTAPSGPAH